MWKREWYIFLKMMLKKKSDVVKNQRCNWNLPITAQCKGEVGRAVSLSFSESLWKKKILHEKLMKKERDRMQGIFFLISRLIWITSESQSYLLILICLNP